MTEADAKRLADSVDLDDMEANLFSSFTNRQRSSGQGRKNPGIEKKQSQSDGKKESLRPRMSGNWEKQREAGKLTEDNDHDNKQLKSRERKGEAQEEKVLMSSAKEGRPTAGTFTQT